MYVGINLFNCIWKGIYQEYTRSQESSQTKKQIRWKQPPWGANGKLPLAFSLSYLVNTRPKGMNWKTNPWLKSSTKNIQHPPKPSVYTLGSSLLDLFSALSQSEQFGHPPLAYNHAEPRRCSCIHTSHLKQCQETNIPKHQTLMVSTVTLAEPDSFGSGPLQGCSKMAHHVFTGSPCHQYPPQLTQLDSQESRCM